MSGNKGGLYNGKIHCNNNYRGLGCQGITVDLVIEMRASVFLSLVIELGILTPPDSSVLSAWVKGQFQLLEPQFTKLVMPMFCNNLLVAI